MLNVVTKQITDWRIEKNAANVKVSYTISTISLGVQ